MAHLPRARAGALTASDGPSRDPRDARDPRDPHVATRPLALAPPASALDVISRLVGAGHEAAIVGGSLRDELLGADPLDWDVATSAPPEVVHTLFPGSSWENRFGTVTVRGEPDVQVTTYRSESGYSDRRRPDAVRWGTSLAGDLERRDFTINALAWQPAAAPEPGRSTGSIPGLLIDPWGGEADLRARILRAVGDPDRRFAEDALRLLRAVRFATRLDLTIEPDTERAIRRHASAAATLSGERVRDELLAWLRSDDPPPSRYLARAEALGLLEPILPELAALRGVPQSKALPGDALDHSLRTVDALPADRPRLRLAGLLHDIGKATTLRDGHFHGHERVGAELAVVALHRLRLPRTEAREIGHLIRQHMFAYDSGWTDAAVRRFVKRVGRPALPDLIALRAADNVASGAREPTNGGTAELIARISAQESAPLEGHQLAVDGHDLQRALDIEPGPDLGRILDALLERVLDDPALNEPVTLLALAREMRDSGVESRGA